MERLIRELNNNDNNNKNGKALLYFAMKSWQEGIFSQFAFILK